MCQRADLAPQYPLGAAAPIGETTPPPHKLERGGIWGPELHLRNAVIPRSWPGPMPQAQPSPASRNWIPESGGSVAKGALGGGAGRCSRGQHWEWGSEESLQPRLRMGFSSASSCPAGPRGWLGAHQKLEQATSLAASQSLL